MAKTQFREYVSKERLSVLARRIIELLKEADSDLEASDACDQLTSDKTLSPSMTEWETGKYENGRSHFRIMINYLTDELRGAGWLIKGRNGTLWHITPDGLCALDSFKEPAAFYEELQTRYEKWRVELCEKGIYWPLVDIDKDKHWPHNPSGKYSHDSASTQETPIETAQSTIGQSEQESGTDITAIQELADATIKKHFMDMSGEDFQTIVRELLTAMGYHVKWGTERGPDGGIDIIAYKDPLGLETPRIKVQCKRWKDAVPRKELQAFHSTLCSEDIGLFFATGGFKSEAERWVRELKERHITTFDLKEFVDLWAEYENKLSGSAKKLFPLKSVHAVSYQD